MAETYRTPGHNEPEKRKGPDRRGCFGQFLPLPISNKGDLGFRARRSPLSGADEIVLNGVSGILSTDSFSPFIKYLYCLRIVNSYLEESAVAREFDKVLSSGAVDRDEGIATLKKIVTGKQLVFLPLTDKMRGRTGINEQRRN